MIYTIISATKLQLYEEVNQIVSQKVTISYISFTYLFSITIGILEYYALKLLSIGDYKFWPFLHVFKD